MTEVLAPVARTASATVLKTGTLSSNFWPPFPGVTPATTLVPYSIICFAWNDPSRPVMPCTTSRVSFPMKMLTLPPLASATAFCTASSMSVMRGHAVLSRIFIAISSLVPVRRITIGTLS